MKYLEILSQLLNVLFYKGDPDESLSARAWRQRHTGWPKAYARIDAVLGDGHCERVYNGQQARFLKR